MSKISFDWIETRYSNKTRELLYMLSQDDAVLTQINTIIGKALNQFVPMKNGDLRRSMYADAEGVHWGVGLPYAHYQYEGIVYAVNFPQRDEFGTILGWRTPKGMRKYPTARVLGTPGFYDGWRFGYTTPNTSSNWTKFYTANQWTMGSTGIKAETNKAITAYLKAECRKRGLST